MLFDSENEASTRAAEHYLSPEPVHPMPERFGALRDLWLTLLRGRAEERYEMRSLLRMARGERLDTLGLEVRDEGTTRRKSERWLTQLIALGLRPDHLCIEYGCGSLWCAEPIIRHLDRGRFVGLDVTEHFFELGCRRLRPLLDEKQVRLDVISKDVLATTAALAPDFVFSHRVLHHVPRRALRGYMRKLCTLLSERTVLVIEHMPRPLQGSLVRARRYGASDLQRHLPRDWICQTYPFGFVMTHRDRPAPFLAAAQELW
jgi:hypothetical protein